MKKILIFIFMLITLTSFTIATLDSSCLNYYDMQTLDTGKVNDLCGTTDLTINGATAGATGIIDNAYSFITDDYMTAGTISSGTRSISFWFKPSSIAIRGYILDFRASGVGYCFLGNNGDVGCSSGTAYLNNVTVGTSWVGVGSVTVGNWYHFMIVDMSITSSTPNYIGRRHTNIEFFNGIIDELYISSSSFNQTERNYLYSSGAPTTAQQPPFVPSTPPAVNMSTSLIYPINKSTSYDYIGWINISLLNVNGSASCSLNNSDWIFNNNDNSTYSFYRADTPAHHNYSISYSCQDSGGVWSNSSFWFNIENLLTINIFDEQTKKRINESISFIFRSGDYEYHDTTTNGTFILYNESGLPPDTYQITLNGSEYYQRIYYLTITNNQIQNNNFYMLRTNSSSLVTFYIRNMADISIENISIVFTTWINLTESKAPITHRYTDYAGSMLVNLHYLTRYGITLTDPSGTYTPRYTEIEPVFPSYTLLLDYNTSQNFTTLWDHISYNIEQTNTSMDPIETNFTMTTTSDNGNIKSYGLYTTIGGVYYVSNITTDASGGTTSLTLPLNESDSTNLEIKYFIETLDPNTLILPLTYSIFNISVWAGNNSLAVVLPEYREEFSERFRLLTAIFCSIIVIAGFSLFIRRNYAPLVGIPVLIFFAVPPISWIPAWIVIFMSIIIGGFFIAFGDW